MYAITGITGQVGGVVARNLLDAGLPVRAVLRDAAKGAVWIERGCEIALAAMTDTAALTAALTGTEAAPADSADVRPGAGLSGDRGDHCS